RQAEGAAGQRGAQQALLVRLGAGAQPQQQVAGFRAGEHRVLVRQVDTAYLTGGQGAANGLGFLEVAYQHGNVAGLQGVQLPVAEKAGLPLACEVEQPGDFAGGTLGQRLAVLTGTQWLLAGPQAQLQRGWDLPLDLPDFAATLG